MVQGASKAYSDACEEMDEVYFIGSQESQKKLDTRMPVGLRNPICHMVIGPHGYEEIMIAGQLYSPHILKDSLVVTLRSGYLTIYVTILDPQNLSTDTS